MAITVIFEEKPPRDFDKAVDAHAHGDGIILRDKDGKEVFANSGPIVAIILNGERIDWPPEG